MAPKSRPGISLALIVLLGLLLVAPAPIAASPSEIKAHPTQESDDEKEDSASAAEPAQGRAASAESATAKKGSAGQRPKTFESVQCSKFPHFCSNSRLYSRG